MNKLAKNYFSVRLAFVYKGPLESEKFTELIKTAKLFIDKIYKEADVIVIEAKSVNQKQKGIVRFMRSVNVPDIGNIHVLGDNRYEIAMRLGLIFNFIPSTLIHQIVQKSNHPVTRKNLIQVLSMLYSKEQNKLYWDVHIKRTMDVLLRDPDKKLRRDALFIEMIGNPAEAKRHIIKLLKREEDVSERYQLEILNSIIESHLSDPKDINSDPTEFESRAAFPLFLDETLDVVASRYSKIAKVNKDTIVPVLSSSHLLELVFDGWDAKAFFIKPHNYRVGCVYFKGKDASSLAISLSATLHYLPVSLARPLSWTSQSDIAADGIMALALNTLTKFTPGKGPDEDFTNLIFSMSSSGFHTSAKATASEIQNYLFGKQPVTNLITKLAHEFK